ARCLVIMGRNAMHHFQLTVEKKGKARMVPGTTTESVALKPRLSTESDLGLISHRETFSQEEGKRSAGFPPPQVGHSYNLPPPICVPRMHHHNMPCACLCASKF
ncbi:hypothetical protein JRQ81_019342, partial [Phrynocephalus forsythii]